MINRYRFRPVKAIPVKNSKSGLCSKLRNEVAGLRNEMASLREAVASLEATHNPVMPVIAVDADARAAVKKKRIEEREVANREHTEFLAKQEIAKPEKDRTREEWEKKELLRKKELQRQISKKWRAENPERLRTWNLAWRANNPEKYQAAKDRASQSRRARRAAAKQIASSPDLVGGLS
jgi:hypothetical protein